MSFLKADDVARLTHDELIDAMVYSNESVDPTTETSRRLRSYYSMLSLAELREKASKQDLLCESKPVVVTPQEQRRRDRECDKMRVQTRSNVRPKRTIKRSREYSTLELVIVDLALLPWVDDVTEICPDVIGVCSSLDKNEVRKRVAVIAKKHLYTGEVVIRKT